MKSYYIYIMTNKPEGTLYIGVTNDIERRVFEHRQGLGSKFVKKYQLHRLIYIEECGEINVARQRERSLKRWNRSWKLELISKSNPEWVDLCPCDYEGDPETINITLGDPRVKPEENSINKPEENSEINFEKSKKVGHA